eukprot:g6127.t1
MVSRSRVLMALLCGPALAAAGLLDSLFGGSGVSFEKEVALTRAHMDVLDCSVSDWSGWSPCSETCGLTGARLRSRSVLRLPVTWEGGRACPAVREHQPCNRAVVCPRRSATAPACGHASKCVCACMAQGSADGMGMDWSGACESACGEVKRREVENAQTRWPHVHVAKRVRADQVAVHAAANVSSALRSAVTTSAPARPAQAMLRLQQKAGNAAVLQVLVSNAARFGGFRMVVASAAGVAAPVGGASGGRAEAKGFGMSTNTASGSVLGFSELPSSDFQPTAGALGANYHVLTEVQLDRASGKHSWWDFARELCVRGAVLSDGHGGAIVADDQCSMLADPHTDAPTPAPTQPASLADLTLRFGGATSTMFTEKTRKALRQAVSTASMTPVGDVRIVRLTPGSTGAGGAAQMSYFVDVLMVLRLKDLAKINLIEADITARRRSFVDTVLDRLFAQGVRSLTRKPHVDVQSFSVTAAGTDANAPPGTAEHRDCRFAWGEWGACSVLCGGGGTQGRRAVVLRPATGDGEVCPQAQQRSCGDKPCKRTRSPTPMPTPMPTVPPPPTPAPTAWFASHPTAYPTPSPTRAGQVYTSNECSHTMCRVLKSMDPRTHKKVHVIRVMHAMEEAEGVRHRCMYNEVRTRPWRLEVEI